MARKVEDQRTRLAFGGGSAYGLNDVKRKTSVVYYAGERLTVEQFDKAVLNALRHCVSDGRSRRDDYNSASVYQVARWMYSRPMPATRERIAASLARLTKARLVKCDTYGSLSYYVPRKKAAR